MGMLVVTTIDIQLYDDDNDRYDDDDDDDDDQDDDDEDDDDEEEIGVTSWQLAAIKEIAKSFLFRRRKTVTLLKY